MYKLRYFFDFGSKTCLWSGNEATHQYFNDYSVDILKLSISQTLQKRIEFAVSWYDTFLDWENVPKSSQWKDKEINQFNATAQEILFLLRQELGAGFEMVDESETSHQELNYLSIL